MFAHVLFLILFFYNVVCDKIESPLQGVREEIITSSTISSSGEISKKTEFVYQIPTGGKAKGVIFLAHGCSHRATDWFSQNEKCTTCTGLIVEREIVYRSLELGLVVVAISSQDEDSKCWSKQDIPNVIIVLDKVYDDHRLNKAQVPLFMLGASSGGAFVGNLGSYLVRESNQFKFYVKSICVQISSIAVQEISTLAVSQAKHQYTFPPLSVVFNHMPRDGFTARAVSRSVKALMDRGISVLIIETTPSKVFPSYFSDVRGGTSIMSADSSKNIIEKFTINGMIDNDHHLASDPREIDWRTPIKDSGILPKYEGSLMADKSNISELLNLAYAVHEITDFKIVETLQWMMKTSSNPSRN